MSATVQTSFVVDSYRAFEDALEEQSLEEDLIVKKYLIEIEVLHKVNGVWEEKLKFFRFNSVELPESEQELHQMWKQTILELNETKETFEERQILKALDALSEDSVAVKRVFKELREVQPKAHKKIWEKFDDAYKALRSMSYKEEFSGEICLISESVSLVYAPDSAPKRARTLNYKRTFNKYCKFCKKIETTARKLIACYGNPLIHYCNRQCQRRGLQLSRSAVILLKPQR